VGIASLDELIAETVPKGIRQTEPLDFGPPLSERGGLDHMRATANKNRVLTSLIGQGYHGTIMPPAIQRNILENPAWYTAYTPYQPEISQGRLEALLNFQTLVSDLTGLDVANASLLDEATAAAEAMALAHRVTKSKASTFFVDKECLPQTIAVLRTRAEPLGWQIVVGDPFKDLEFERVFGAIFQYPGVCGECHDFSALASKLHAAKALAVIAAERGDAERAGRLWGAIESNETSGPVRGWEDSRKEYEALVLRADGPPFARARTEGRLLSIAEAAGLDSRQLG
jgi:glycine dehydrogenase